ncbi:hypothetical protein ACCS84_33185 [Rhizobium ruizarguesonis]
MMADQIKVGRWYARAGVTKQRKVQAIKDGVVEYTVNGLLTFASLKMSVKEFSNWANRVIEEPSSH